MSVLTPNKILEYLNTLSYEERRQAKLVVSELCFGNRSLEILNKIFACETKKILESLVSLTIISLSNNLYSIPMHNLLLAKSLINQINDFDGYAYSGTPFYSQPISHLATTLSTLA